MLDVQILQSGWPTVTIQMPTRTRDRVLNKKYPTLCGNQYGVHSWPQRRFQLHMARCSHQHLKKSTMPDTFLTQFMFCKYNSSKNPAYSVHRHANFCWRKADVRHREYVTSPLDLIRADLSICTIYAPLAVQVHEETCLGATTCPTHANTNPWHFHDVVNVSYIAATIRSTTAHTHTNTCYEDSKMCRLCSDKSRHLS